MTIVEAQLVVPPSSDEPLRQSFGRLSSPNVAHQRLGSPSSKLRNGLHESIHSSRVLRDLSPSRVFASTPLSTTRTSLPDLFKQRNCLQLLRPSYSVDAEAQDESNRQPKLLSRLQSLLNEKLELVDRLGGAQKGFAAAQLRTDAYRQVYDAFLHSFTTYRSLLMRIKHEYDLALDDALASVYDNVHMRAELAVSDERMETAVLEARNEAEQDAAAARREMQDQVALEEAKLMECEERSKAAELAIAQCYTSNSRLRRELEQLREENNQLKRDLISRSSWHTPELLAAYQEKLKPAKV